jgi:hypothetical protein
VLERKRQRERRLREDPDYRDLRAARQRERYRDDPAYREHKLAQNRGWYSNLSGYEYNKRLLAGRRRQALLSMKKRHETGEVDSG